MPASVVPILRSASKKVLKSDRAQLVGIYDQYKSMSRELLRRVVIEQGRVDVLAKYVLGYEVKPFHVRLLQFQIRHTKTLQLAFRGAGKTTICTVAFAIWLLIIDRNLRILIASKTKTNAQDFLKEIKGHLETNVMLIETFGEFYDPSKVGKWDSSEIEVVGRKKVTKEASISCTGVDSAVVSKHYDVILPDDLVDEENSRTKHMRDKTNTWVYQSLKPTLLPPDPERPHVGRFNALGTRYHFDDQYGRWIAGEEFKDRVQIVPALDKNGHSPWPEKYTPAWFLEQKREAGTIIFNAQYQCDTEAMKGEIFQYDDCQQIPESEYPDIKTLKIFGGIDLAITGEEQNDKFAWIMIGVIGEVMRGKELDAIYILDWYEDHTRFPQQKPKILEAYDRWDPIAMGSESNAFQLASLQDVKVGRPNARIVPVYTKEDKIARAWKLSAMFEAKKVFFKKHVHGPLIDRLILFPNIGKDIFDALDTAVATAKRKRKSRKPRTEPGVIRYGRGR